MRTLVLSNQITYEQTKLLLDSLYRLSNQVAFHVPNYFTISLSEHNSKIHTQISRLATQPDIQDNKYLVYLESVNPFLLQIQKNIVEIKDDVCFLGQVFQYTTKKYLLRFDDVLLNYLKVKKSLYDWDYPVSPVDLSFLHNGRCILQTIAHEKYSCLYVSDNSLINALRDSGIQFYYDHSTTGDIPSWE